MTTSTSPTEPGATGEPVPDEHVSGRETTSAGLPGVLVATDGSESAIAAVKWAAAEAQLRGVPLTLANIYSTRIVSYPSEMPITVFEVLRDDSEHVVQEAAASVRAQWPDLPTAAVSRTGAVIPVLGEEAEGKELAVIGTRGLGGFSGLLLGSVGMGLTAQASCAVAVIRGEVPAPGTDTTSPIVVGVDGSHHADHALTSAFEEARLRRCPLRIVHCWQDPTSDAFTTNGPKLPEFDQKQWESLAATQLVEQVATLQSSYPDVQVETVVDWRRPTVALLERSEGAQLLVVGSRGRGALKGFVLGSTSRVMVQHATCPVLVTKVPAES